MHAGPSPAQMVPIRQPVPLPNLRDPHRGPVSGAALESVLCTDEHAFDRFGWKKLSAKIGLHGSREQWVSFCRYVDDVFAHSRWFCPSCIERLIALIYGRTVHFDTANEGHAYISSYTIVKFLDLWIYSSFSGWFVTFAYKRAR